MSSPISPSGTSTPSSASGRASAANRSATTRSTGSSIAARAPSPAASARPASSTSSPAHSDEPTEWPWAAKNGKHIAPPIRIVSATSWKRSITAILSVTLAPPSTATSGPGGVVQQPRERRDLLLEQQTRRPLGDQPRHALGRGVRPVGGPERVVHVHVGEPRQRGRQLWIVAGLARLVADVLEHQHVSRVEVVGERLDILPHDGRRQRHVGAGQLGQPVGGGPHRQLRLAVLGTAEVRDDHERGAASAELRDRRQRRADPRVVGDLARPSSGTLKSTLTSTRLPSRSPRSDSVLKAACQPDPRSGWSSPTRCRTTTPA